MFRRSQLPLRRRRGDHCQGRRVSGCEWVWCCSEDERPRTGARPRPAHKVDEVYADLLVAPAITDLVAQLIGPNLRMEHTKLNLKPASGGEPVESHQDWAFYPHTNDDILEVRMMLEDCTIDNGPLLVIPGSHVGPVFDHHHPGYFVGAIDPAASAQASPNPGESLARSCQAEPL
jgi:hypothetical protein